MSPTQCERRFRPKSSYWWLAWTWENLLFSCKNCNTPKLTRFPLARARCLQPRQTPPGAEQPLLIDPANPRDGDPINHIQFRSDGYGGWRPWPREGSRRGAEIILTCQLDRAPLRDQHRRQAEWFEDAVRRVQDAIQTRNPGQIQATWGNICRRWVTARAPFAALHFDMLDHHFPSLLRKRHDLDLFIR